MNGYKKIIFNAMLLITSALDYVDVTIRWAAGIAGIALTVYLIIKARHDIASRKLDNEIKKLEIEKLHQQIGDAIQENKKKHG